MRSHVSLWDSWVPISLVAAVALFAGCAQKHSGDDLEVDLRRRTRVEQEAPSPGVEKRGAADPAGESAAESPEASASGGDSDLSANSKTEAEDHADASNARAQAGSPPGVPPGAKTASSAGGRSSAGPPVFVGGPPKKLTSTPQEAVRAAKHRLAVARSASRQGDSDAAVEAAIQAFEIASEFETESGECQAIADQARLLIESMGPRSPAAAPVRTEFR